MSDTNINVVPLTPQEESRERTVSQPFIFADQRLSVIVTIFSRSEILNQIWTGSLATIETREDHSVSIILQALEDHQIYDVPLKTLMKEPEIYEAFIKVMAKYSEAKKDHGQAFLNMMWKSLEQCSLEQNKISKPKVE